MREELHYCERSHRQLDQEENSLIMCGILSVIGDGLPGDVEFEEALRLIAHRGPDDTGVFRTDSALLGTRRLSIIDLSEAGHQPFVDHASGAAITYNGEIYNYVELRTELESVGHSFRSRTDTEVLLKAYLQWGKECLGRLNGMWAFVIWDPREGRAFVARDRFGEKPLYYANIGGSLSVASEPKSLLALLPDLRRADDSAVYDLLARGQMPLNRSFYTDIEALEPGCAGWYAPGESRLRPWRYWSLPEVDPDQPSEAEAVDRFAATFEDAVAIRMRSDVPVGLTLSGGLDSTAVLDAADAASDQSPLTAFTSVYGSDGATSEDEREWAEIAARPYSQVQLDRVRADGSEWLDALRKITWHMDSPGHSPAVFPLWKIMERARGHGIPVLLEGQGGDEILAGYNHHFALALLDSLELLVRRPSTSRARDFDTSVRGGARAFGVGRLAAEAVAEEAPRLKNTYWRVAGALSVLRPDFARSASRAFDEDENHDGGRSGRLERGLVADFSRRTLPGFLHYGDAIAMAHSVENRLPFLDYRLVDYCFRLASEKKIGAGETKRVLREYLRRKGQHAIAGRLDKKGYPTPARSWMSDEGGALASDVLLDRDACIHRYAEPRRIERFIGRHAASRVVVSDQLYRLIATEVWLQTCIKAGA